MMSGNGNGAAEQLTGWLLRGRHEVFMVQVQMTPDLAALMLERNIANRNLTLGGQGRSVAAFAAAMQRGEWKLNGESIIISNNGELNDGQHRLAAVVRAGVEVPMLLTFGVERETRHTLDQGIGRSPSHILQMFGEKATTNLATTLQFAYAYDHGKGFNVRPSSEELLDTLHKHPELRDRLREVFYVIKVFRLSAGYIAGAHWLTTAYDPPRAKEFLSAVTTGAGVTSAHHPVARIRTIFMQHFAKTNRRTSVEQAANYIKAFNTWASREKRFVTWTEALGDPFPRVGARTSREGDDTQSQSPEPPVDG
jgi:hypothetical protein